MAVFYRLHQDQSTGTKRSGKWYARAVPTACIGTRQLDGFGSFKIGIESKGAQTAAKYSVGEHVVHGPWSAIL